MIAQLLEAARHSANGEYAVPSGVPSRLLLSGPAHIERPSFAQALVAFATTVMSSFIVRPTVKFKLWWNLSKHIQEAFEWPQPRANAYSPSAVIAVLRRVRVLTTRHHIGPCSVSFGGFCMRGVPVFGVALMRAPACLSESESEGFVHDDLCVPATQAKTQAPSTKAIFQLARRRRVFQNFHVSKGASNERRFGRHNGSSSIVLFSSGRTATTGAHCDSM